MKLVTDRAQRNYNYLEIIGAYNDLLNNCEDGYISEKQFNQFSRELGAKLIGTNGVVNTLNALVSAKNNENNSLDLFEFDGDNYLLFKEKPILPPASREEVLLIYSMLENGDFDLMLNDEVKNKIKANVDRFFENLGETPENLYGYIDFKGESLCADTLSEIKDCYIALNKAKENGSFVKISYDYNDEINEHIIKPVGFVYSQLDLRLRVRAYVKTGEQWTFYLSNIKSLESLNGNAFDVPEEKKPEMKELVFSFENTHNRAERVAARFSDYNKTVKYSKKKNIITYTVYYSDNMTENNRIFYRLRSLGKGIDIKSGEKKRVKADALKALANYKNGTKNEE